MSSKHTTLCVVNFSGFDITNTKVTEVDNYDWDGDSRPDHNFKDAVIKFNNSCCEREEINTHSKGCWYRLTFTFSNGQTLSFRNDQKDAETKHNRSYDATGSAIDQKTMTLYQGSGGDTNGMYIRSLPEPDNSNWMGNLLSRKPNVRLNELVMPGSHDAGVYTTTNCTLACQPEWARAQGLNSAEQLKAGSRYFDFRVYYDGHDYRLGHFGSAGGCYGATLSDVLEQVNTFIQSHRKETVILKFSHTMSDSPVSFDVQKVAKATVDMVKNQLGTNLYTSQNTGSDLAKTLLNEVSGKVVATFDDEFESYWNTSTGIFPYRDYATPGYGLRVCDKYSETKSLSEMASDQTSKLQQYGGWGNDYLFLLSWTLTGGAGLLDVEVLANMANPWLPQKLSDIKAGTLKHPNIVYIDFINSWMGRAIIDLNN